MAGPFWVRLNKYQSFIAYVFQFHRSIINSFDKPAAVNTQMTYKVITVCKTMSYQALPYIYIW